MVGISWRRRVEGAWPQYRADSPRRVDLASRLSPLRPGRHAASWMDCLIARPSAASRACRVHAVCGTARTRGLGARPRFPCAPAWRPCSRLADAQPPGRREPLPERPHLVRWVAALSARKVLRPKSYAVIWKLATPEHRPRGRSGATARTLPTSPLLGLKGDR